MINHRLRITLLVTLTILLVSCGTPRLSTRSPLALAEASENDVSVSLRLELDSVGQVWLAGTFTPKAGFHLYSKDLPLEGVQGLGRPTLLELTSDSHLQVAGELSESVTAQQLEGAPEGLLVYPTGPVTLRLPVTLPEDSGWSDDQVSVTYTACSETTCLPPVVGKLIPVRVPGTEEIKP